jgi:anaphase-promoting complex subunit 7
MKKDTASALQFVDKAIKCSPRYVYAHHLRGSLLLSDRKPEQAITSFHRANEISGDIDSYEGLVECYLASNKTREALFSAKEAINLFPKDPRAMSMIGLTLSRTCKGPTRGSSTHGLDEKAKAALRKALKLDPCAPRPLLTLVEMYLQSKEYDECVEILQNAIDSISDSGLRDSTYIWSSFNVTHLQPLSFYCSGATARDCRDVLYTKLGIVHTLNKNFIEACKCLHIALSLNPSYNEAHRASETLEKILSGEDDHLNCSDDERDNNSEPEY